MTATVFSSLALDYLGRHGIDPELAREVGVGELEGALTYRYEDALGEYRRRRPLDGTRTFQPQGRELGLWWPAGRPAAGADVLVCEGEPDALAALTALASLNGSAPVEAPAVTALPGTGMPTTRVVSELRDAGVSTIYLALDADDAGRKASAGLLAELADATITTAVVELPDGQDLADVLAGARGAGRDAGRALANMLADAEAATEAPRAEADAEPGRGVRAGAVATPYSTIRPERVRWAWPGRVPFGMVTLLAGDPGLGKSTVSCHLAAEVSRQGGAVLLTTAEDSQGATVRPRLEAAGAVLDRVFAVTLRREGVEEGLVLPDDVADLAELVERTEARLVVIDPLMAHLGGRVDSFKDKSVREALAPLYRLAEAHGVAVVVIVHLNKSQGGDPLHRIGGSIGIPGAARSALLLARDPEDPEGERGPRRVLAHVKCNVAPLAPSLACRVEGATLADEDGTATVRFVVDGESPLSGAELLARPPDAEERTERDEAAGFLVDELAGGPRPVRDVERAAKDAGIAEKTLRRAKGNLGITSTKEGFGAGWTWALPEGGQPPVAAFADAQDDHLREAPVTAGDSAPSPTRTPPKVVTPRDVTTFGDEGEFIARAERLAARHADLAAEDEL